MIARDQHASNLAVKSNGERTTAGLPAGAEFQQIAFTTAPSAEQQVVLEFPHPNPVCAIDVTHRPDTQLPAGTHRLSILFLATSRDTESLQHDSETLAQMRAWVEDSPMVQPNKSQLMTLQGTQVFWAQGRFAILAAADRLASVRAALIEAYYYESELHDIERSLGEAWPQLEADTPLAFEFDEASIGKRNKLRQRFLQIASIRMRLARILPHVHCPHLHPPTLASQVGERLRERTRLVHRYEYLDEQLEVFENAYENCAERASNFMLTRSGNTLEWVIILLLLTQIFLAGFEIVTNLPEASETTTTTSSVGAGK